ncbi:MAG: tetratricopeptide repeat protein [Lachnospiraceae bacterium]|nr:tetratricopeptide repeat protein [Lachnospiraceae bacterium]
MIRRRIALFFLLTVFALVPVLSGCTSRSEAAMAEYKALGISQMEEGDFAGAADSFQTALDQSVGTLGAQEIDISYYKALALFLSGDTDGAIEVYTALIDYDEDNWEAYYLRGNIYLKEGQDDQALADYAEAASLNGNDPELCVHIYENLANSGLQEDAQSYLDTALSMEPSDSADYYYLGDIYYLTGDYDNAKTYLLTAREQGYDEATLLLATVYADTGDDASAREMYEAYMEEHPDDAAALGRLGEIALSSGDYEQAISYLTQAKETADEASLGTIVNNLVAAYEYSGDFQSAYNVAGEYLANHSDEALQREYEFLGTRVGAYPEAIEDDLEPLDLSDQDEESSNEDESIDESESLDEDEYDPYDDSYDEEDDR